MSPNLHRSQDSFGKEHQDLPMQGVCEVTTPESMPEPEPIETTDLCSRLSTEQHSLTEHAFHKTDVQ
jgi:hypothetical protein